MSTAKQLIEEYKKLPIAEQDEVIYFFTNEVIFKLDEDHDIGLDEDIAEARNIKRDEANEEIRAVPFHDVWAKTVDRLHQETA